MFIRYVNICELSVILAGRETYIYTHTHKAMVI
jgi:hypothetical protein